MNSMTSTEDLAWWLRIFESLDWTFASTMQDTPHSYMVRGRTMPEDDFMRAVRVIRTFGEPGKFWNSTNIYLVDRESGNRWWTMGDTLDGTIIINRAPADQVYGPQNAPHTASAEWSVYDELATDYDARYTSPEEREEELVIMRLIRSVLGPVAPRTLDVGCGTGLLLDHKITHHSLYTGVDPSQAMLNELVRKHRQVTDIHPVTWEQFSGAPANVEMVAHRRKQLGPYDLVVSLFGSPSYIAPSHISTMVELAHRLVVLMHYKEGYLPDYHRTRPDTVDASREAAAAIPGARVFELNNFQVTVVER